MSVNILLKRSSTANKRPVAASMAFGELNLNYDAATGGLYYKNSSGAVTKVGPCQVSATAPNASPAGSAGNSAGEFWYDTTSGTLKVYDGSVWAETGGAVQGVTGTSPITVNNADPLNPVIGVDYASTSQSGVVQLNDTVTSASATEAATANAAKTAYDAAVAAQDTADAALPKAGGTMSGDITFNAGQVFPVAGIQDATLVQKGVVQVGTNIDVAAGVISVADSSTSGKGVVQLNDSTSSTSTTEALTAAQGKSLQDQIDALVVSSNISLAGTFNAATGLVDSVTSAGTAAGFVVGNSLPAAAPSNADFFVIVDVQGSSGPSGTPPYHIGDWFLSDGTSWQFLNVGFQASAATTTNEGVVYLATDAEVQAGADTSNKAINPASLQSKVSDSVSTVSSTTLASSTAVKDAYDAGIQGQTDAAAAQATADQAIIDASDAQGTADQAIIDAAAAQATADAALPKAGGTMTGNITFSDSGEGVVFSDASQISAITDSTSTTNSNVAASATAVKAAYDLADSVYNGTFAATARPELQLLQTTSVVSAANQLGVVIDGSTGLMYTVDSFDAGTF